MVRLLGTAFRSEHNARRWSLARQHLIGPALLTTTLLAACVEQTGGDTAQPSEEDVKAARENVLTTAPTPRFVSGAVLDNGGKGRVIYLGADVDTDKVTAGKTFTVTHYFKVEQAVPDGWRLFVHLDAPNDKRLHMNADHVPIGGKYPVQMWKAGEIIRDIHKVMVPASWPTDKVSIYTGLWKGGSRFAVKSGAQDGQNRALVAQLPVVGDAVKGPPPPKRLVARKLKAGVTMTMDGKLDEPSWQDAASTGAFVNTMDGSPALQQGSAKVLWDDQNLYVAFEFADTDIWGTLQKHDDKLWTQEAAELFIDPDGDGKTYIELQVSPRNVTFDSWLPAYRQNDNAWDAPLTTAVAVSGTLDKRDDKDTGWTVEMTIPLSAVKGRLDAVKGVPPQVGTEWRMNFFRMDMPSGKPQNGSAWSPPLVGDFHALDKFGTLVFGDEQGLLVAPAAHTLSPMLQRAAQADPSAPPPGTEGEAAAKVPAAKEAATTGAAKSPAPKAAGKKK